MAFGKKWLGLTLPVAAYLGSASGVIVTQKLTAQTNAPTSLAVATPLPSPNSVIILGPSKVQPEPPNEVEEPPDPLADRELPLPPDYFDITALGKTRNDGTDPPILKPGQSIDVEVLEALPGRQITGRRVIRPDGTISLGFYGDLRVAELNRYQIKVKLIELLVKHLKNDVLGLEENRDGKRVQVPAVDSGRLYIDESCNFEAQNTPSPPSRSGHDYPTSESLRSQVEALGTKVEQLISKTSRPGQPETPIPDGKPDATPNPARPALSPSPPAPQGNE